MQSIHVMKKSTLSLISILIIVFAACTHSPKIHEPDSTLTASNNGTRAKIVTTSQLTTPQDTQALHAQHIEEGKKYLRNNWMNVIHVKKGAFKTGKNNTGIFKLTIDVENSTAYAIDSMKFLVPFYAKGECIKIGR